MYKEECVLKNKIFHPSVMYYILSTIVYPLSPTYRSLSKIRQESHISQSQKASAL